MAALETSVSTGPSAREASATIARHWAGSRTSARTAIALPPAPQIASTTASAAPSLRSQFTATAAPWRASSFAVAAPIPRLPPVTSTTRSLIMASSSLGDLQHDLPEVAVLLHHPVGLDDLVEREDLLDDGDDGPVGELRQRGPRELGDDLGLVLHRARAEHGADDLLPLDHHERQVQLRLDAGDDADDDEPARVAERAHVRGEVLRADVVEDDVDPLLAGELLHALGGVGGRRVVDDQVGP